MEIRKYIISQKLKVFTAQISKLDQLSLQGVRGSRRCSNYLISLLANLPTNTNTNTNINTNTNTNTGISDDDERGKGRSDREGGGGVLL